MNKTLLIMTIGGLCALLFTSCIFRQESTSDRINYYAIDNLQLFFAITNTSVFVSDDPSSFLDKASLKARNTYINLNGDDPAVLYIAKKNPQVIGVYSPDPSGRSLNQWLLWLPQKVDKPGLLQLKIKPLSLIADGCTIRVLTPQEIEDLPRSMGRARSSMDASQETLDLLSILNVNKEPLTLHVERINQDKRKINFSNGDYIICEAFVSGDVVYRYPNIYACGIYPNTIVMDSEGDIMSIRCKQTHILQVPSFIANNFFCDYRSIDLSRSDIDVVHYKLDLLPSRHPDCHKR